MLTLGGEVDSHAVNPRSLGCGAMDETAPEPQDPTHGDLTHGDLTPEDLADGPVVDMTPELAQRLAAAVDGPTRRTSRILQVVLVVAGAVLATLAAAADNPLLRVLALAILALVVVLCGADVARRRRTTAAIGRQERVAVRYDAGARVVRFPLAGTEHPLAAFTGVRLTDDVLVLTRKDSTRTPVPVEAIPVEQREALIEALTR